MHGEPINFSLSLQIGSEGIYSIVNLLCIFPEFFGPNLQFIFLGKVPFQVG